MHYFILGFFPDFRRSEFANAVIPIENAKVPLICRQSFLQLDRNGCSRFPRNNSWRRGCMDDVEYQLVKTADSTKLIVSDLRGSGISFLQKENI